MRVVVFVEENLFLTFIVLYFLSHLFSFLLIRCERDEKCFWKNLREWCWWNTGVILHLTLCCLIENASIFNVEERAQGDNEVCVPRRKLRWSIRHSQNVYWVQELAVQLLANWGRCVFRFAQQSNQWTCKTSIFIFEWKMKVPLFVSSYI